MPRPVSPSTSAGKIAAWSAGNETSESRNSGVGVTHARSSALRSVVGVGGSGL